MVCEGMSCGNCINAKTTTALIAAIMMRVTISPLCLAIVRSFLSPALPERWRAYEMPWR